MPATRPAPAAGFDGAGKLGPGLHAQPLERRGVIVERMPGEKKADRVEFALQTLRRQPRLYRGKTIGSGAAGRPNSSDCPIAASSNARCEAARMM